MKQLQYMNIMLVYHFEYDLLFQIKSHRWETHDM